MKIHMVALSKVQIDTILPLHLLTHHQKDPCGYLVLRAT
jgi:hypothetical protein